MYVLTLIFNREKTKVLTRIQKEDKEQNFISGKMLEDEQPKDAAYRVLEKMTGIAKDKVDLKFIRHENVSNALHEVWNMSVQAGVLKEDVDLVPDEENNLVWLDINDLHALVMMRGRGNCLTFLLESVLALEITMPPYYYITW